MKNKLFHLRTTNYKLRTDSGSALILTVVLTSLLAVIGVMFVLVTRVDKISTSAIIENKEMSLAVETVIAKISQQLILDTPGIVDPNQSIREYYDYPDSANPWLASLEPEWNDNGTPLIPGDDWYFWRHITDLYNVRGYQTGILEFLRNISWEDTYGRVAGPDNLVVSIVLPSDGVTGSHQPGNMANYVAFGGPADADGDGVVDSRWIQLPDMTGSKGKPIYAAVRVIDNGAMLNVNTAYNFDPCDPNPTRIDGSSQTQIDLLTLAERGVNPGALLSLDNERYGSEPHNLNSYITNVVWRYNRPNGAYTPFDISDELELRNGFTLNHEYIDTRIEKELAWTKTFNDPNELHTPVDTNGIERHKWFYRTQHDVQGPIDIYSYRHIATTYNMDRIINAIGGKMANVNTADKYTLYAAIRQGLYEAGIFDPNGLAAQMAVNIKDYSDGGLPYFLPSHPHYDPNNDVSALRIDGNFYYGFEQPCIYISELVHWFLPIQPPGAIARSYAIELYKRYPGVIDPNDWQIVVDGNPPISINWPTGRQFCVLLNQHPDANFSDDLLINIDPAVVRDSPGLTFDAGNNIQLQRFVQGVGYITVDSRDVPPQHPRGWLRQGSHAYSFQRDITSHKCIRRLWDDASFSQVYPPTFGVTNSYPPVPDPDPYQIQARPANKPFTNIGEIGMVFRKPAYYDPNIPADRPRTIGYSNATDEEHEVRINLADPSFQHLFKYLTVFDPGNDSIDNDGDGQIDIFDISGPEWKVPGRININTAPWFVIAQLPWVSQRRDEPTTNELARAIVDYRNQFGAFENIGQLNRVGIGDPNNYRSIDYYARDANDLSALPDLTWNDGVGYDFEERDVIFSRISNLVTVRSDVFTAYILVRIGADGPQKRVIAILDRSDVYYDPVTRRMAGKVKIVSLHPVPDPR